MSENEGENPHFSLLNLLQGKQLSTILKTLRTFQDTQKPPVNGWAKSGLWYKRARDKIYSHI